MKQGSKRIIFVYDQCQRKHIPVQDIVVTMTTGHIKLHVLQNWC